MFAREIDPKVLPYEVHDVIPGGGESGNELCQDVMEWLKRKNLKYANSGLKAKVLVGISLRKMGGKSSWITKDKRLDVGIVSECENYPLVQIEVESSRNEESTIMKLMYGLIDQLRYYKNKGVLISEVSGFFIPVNPGYFKKVVCSWNDAKLTYIRKCISLRKDEFYTEIRDAFHNQDVVIDDVFSTELVFPLSREFVKHTFGQDAEQMRSGDSIVILCSNEGCVYKHAFEAKEIQTLIRLHLSDCSFQYSSKPCDMKTIDGMIYFKYKALNIPATKEEARADLCTFVHDLVEAITELHEVGYAHLDIRLENVCFNECGHAVLIDLDRSIEVTSSLFGNYGSSQMYHRKNDVWVGENADWKQLSIMIHYILNEHIVDYHEIQIFSDTYSDLFLYTLFSEGKPYMCIMFALCHNHLL